MIVFKKTPQAFFSLFVLFFSISLLSGCVTGVAKKAESLTVKEIPFDAKAYPIALRKVILKVPRSKPLGSVGVGLFCVERGKFTASSGQYRLSDYSFSRAFREELERNNYVVVGDEDALFEDASLNKAKYFIAGLVTDIQTNVCYPLAGWGNFYEGTGNAYLKVEWQVQDTLRRRVVFKATSEGSAEVGSSTAAVRDIMLDDAFAMATQNLLANEKFRDLLTGKSTVKQVAPKTDIKIKNLVFDQSEKFDPVRIRPGVVTIRTPTGHGSGFFINSSGFILTNEHVVSGASTVRVRLHSGREIAAEVIRTDKVRDVALLKSSNEQFVPMSLSFNEPAVGSELLVYGTPQFESLDGTLTKGILSAYRSSNNLRYIQSDVNIVGGSSGGPMMDIKGNVIAITVAAFVDESRSGTGNNLFIPLREAFDVLGIAIPNSGS